MDSVGFTQCATPKCFNVCCLQCGRVFGGKCELDKMLESDRAEFYKRINDVIDWSVYERVNMAFLSHMCDRTLTDYENTTGYNYHCIKCRLSVQPILKSKSA
jgi:hypothetical protein